MSLSQEALNGDMRSAAKLMRMADDRRPGYIEEMARIWQHTGRAHIIGVTGAPGTGKSTLTDALISHYRAQNKQVGVVAVDPSSPFSGGAILGDRIRMGSHSNDEGVFIRSVATRGNLGGLSVSSVDIVAILDAIGKDVVIVETVGVGQSELDIASVSDTCLVVVMPGTGDDIQAIKAGILEIAEVFVINKADREGVERTAGDLRMMLELRGEGALWTPPIVKTVAVKNEGIEELTEAVEKHRAAAFKLRDKRFLRQYSAACGLLKELLFTERFTKERFQEDLSRLGDPYSVVTNWLN